MMPRNIGLNVSMNTDCSECCPRLCKIFCCCRSREKDTEEVDKKVQDITLPKLYNPRFPPSDVPITPSVIPKK